MNEHHIQWWEQLKHLLSTLLTSSYPRGVEKTLNDILRLGWKLWLDIHRQTSGFWKCDHAEGRQVLSRSCFLYLNFVVLGQSVCGAAICGAVTVHGISVKEWGIQLKGFTQRTVACPRGWRRWSIVAFLFFDSLVFYPMGHNCHLSIFISFRNNWHWSSAKCKCVFTLVSQHKHARSLLLH